MALFDEERLIASNSREAPMAASGACLEMLEHLLKSCGVAVADVELFVSDAGPGSFTGVKVGVTLAKSLAFALGAKAAAVSSFDLISPSETVVIPSRKGEWFVRIPGQVGIRTTKLPDGAVGFGPGVSPSTFPEARRAESLLASVVTIAPEQLLPTYLAEPSISTPKTPYRSMSAGADGA